MKKTNRLTIGVAVLAALALVLPLSGHDTGHERPKTMPHVGPHGGDYGKLTRHYAEVVVRGNQATVYILERDIKNVAEDATKVGLSLQVPGKRARPLKLERLKDGSGHVATIAIPPTARRVFFHVTCVLDGKRESGRIQYEPRR